MRTTTDTLKLTTFIHLAGARVTVAYGDGTDEDELEFFQFGAGQYVATEQGERNRFWDIVFLTKNGGIKLWELFTALDAGGRLPRLTHINGESVKHLVHQFKAGCTDADWEQYTF